ncbi:unnamed protein product [Prunus armeniaca]|uniref:Uncharacterized protein n=1 Tax=Prunus armeniaca TaxID=36596 RepID=A0A6J5VF95_PRUAR|nr:unnamed protein product [Prunus armeniaca]
MAEELAGLGATVQYACSSDQAPIDERNQEWESKGVKVTGSVFDLKSTTQRENLMNTFSSAFDGKLNILLQDMQVFSFADLKAEPELSAFAETSKVGVEMGKRQHSHKHCETYVRADDGLCRPAEPNEISSLVSFLCLPASSYINGKEFYIDGQQTVCDPVGMWNQGWPGNSTSTPICHSKGQGQCKGCYYSHE